jgi:uncharacterized protein (TIRG00374 family)
MDPVSQRPSFFTRYGSFLFGVILFAAVIGIGRHLGEGQNFISLLKRASPWGLLAAFILQTGTYVANAGMWHATLRRLEVRTPFRRLLRLSIAKLFIDQAAPSGGLGGSLMVMEAISGKNVPRAAAVRALFVGLTGYYVAYTILFALAMSYIVVFSSVTRLVFWTAVVFGGVVTVFAIAIIASWFIDLTKRLPRVIRERPALQPFIAALNDAPDHISGDWTILAEASLAAAGIFILDALSLWVILISLGLHLTLGSTFASFMVSSVAMTIGLVPGGLGVFEGSSTAMLKFFGVPLEGALTATLILRGFTYWLPMIPGLFITRRELRRSATSET